MFILENFYKANSMDMELINGKMQVYMTAFLPMGKGTARASGNHTMAINSKVNTHKIWSMALANLHGPTAKYMKVNFERIFDMVREHIGIPVVKWASLCGNKDK